MELFDTRFFEMLFLICFGISWPMNIVKAVRGKTSKGVSLWFLLVFFIVSLFDCFLVTKSLCNAHKFLMCLV